jgi:hypothetical protein
MYSRLIALTAFGGLSIILSSCGGNSAVGNQRPVVTGLAAPVANPVTPTGTYTQIERLSRPAVKELFENFQDHKTTNAVEPYSGNPTDPLYAEIKSFTDTVRPPGTGVGAPQYGTTIQSILYPDEMSANLASTSATAGYLGVETGLNSFGGRDPGDDVIGTSLGVVFGNTLSSGLHLLADDGEENNCLSAEHVTQDPSQQKTGTFPYLAGPH